MGLLTNVVINEMLQFRFTHGFFSSAEALYFHSPVAPTEERLEGGLLTLLDDLPSLLLMHAASPSLF